VFALRFSTLVGGSAGGLLLVEVDILVFGDCSGEYEVRFWKAVDEELDWERSVMVSIGGEDDMVFSLLGSIGIDTLMSNDVCGTGAIARRVMCSSAVKASDEPPKVRAC
jgi:hypothetical protein